MEALTLHTGAHTVKLEDNFIIISAVRYKRVSPRVKHIGISVCFLQAQFDNGIFVPIYEKSIVMPTDMCTKPCSGTFISRGTKCMTGFRFYLNNDTE